MDIANIFNVSFRAEARLSMLGKAASALVRYTACRKTIQGSPVPATASFNTVLRELFSQCISIEPEQFSRARLIAFGVV